MSDEFKIQVSLSAPPPAQYAKGAMVNFRGQDVSEVVGQLQEAQAAGLLELASEVEQVWTAAAALGARTEHVTQNNNRQSSPASHATSTQGTPAPSCQHGPRQWKSGKGRTGEWYAWFCSAPKGQSCDAVWANADGSVRD